MPELLARLSLRARLVLGVIALTTVGLAVANVATYASLRSFLVSQTDRALEESHSDIEREVFGHGCADGDGRPVRGASPGDYVALRSTGGRLLCDRQVPVVGEEPGSEPALPDDLTEQVSSLDAGQALYLTVDAQEGGGRYRVRASADHRTGAVFRPRPLAGRR